MAKDHYIYAVTRVHIQERNLLTGRDIEALLSAENMAEALNLLSGKGWDIRLTPADMIMREYEKTWALIAEAAGDVKALDVFRRARDFHNLKAALKLLFAGEPEANWTRYFQPYGTIDTARIIKAAESKSFSGLPDSLAGAGKEAWEALKVTANGQLCEVIIDKAALEDIFNIARSSNIPLLENYAELTVDAANIIAAVRGLNTGRDRVFLERVFAKAGRFSTESLVEAALGDPQDIVRLVRKHGYLDGAARLAESLSAFERWRGDELMKRIRPQRAAISGVEPLAAYILARENEIRMARLVLNAKLSRLSSDAVKERLGQTYV